MTNYEEFKKRSRFRLEIVMIIVLLLVTACNQRPVDETELPNWLVKKIDLANKGRDIQSTTSIWKCTYNNNPVYYFNTYFENDYNYLYNYDGDLIGAPDGGPNNLGDGLVSDFFAKMKDSTVIWQEDKEPSLSTIYDYWYFNNIMIYNMGMPNMLLQRETMFPNYYEQILDTLRTHHVDTHYLTVASYNIKNSEPHLLIDSLLTDSITCISKSYIDSVLNASGWEGFAALHPEFPAYFEFAMPAYDPVDSIGLFVFALHFGSEQRYWRITLGELVDDEWQLMTNDSTGEYYMFDNYDVFSKPVSRDRMNSLFPSLVPLNINR